jgi:hypothetical protein
MPGPEPTPDPAQLVDDLLLRLAALGRAIARWRAELDSACPAQGTGEVAFAPVFRRWLEQLAEIRLHVHRCDHRLLDVALAGGAAPVDHVPLSAGTDRRARLERWFDHVHLATTYVRIERVLELGDESLPADIITDIANLAALADATVPQLAAISLERPYARLQDMAYFTVVAPWRRRGLPAVDAVARWLAETLDEHDDW